MLACTSLSLDPRLGRAQERDRKFFETSAAEREAEQKRQATSEHVPEVEDLMLFIEGQKAKPRPAGAAEDDEEVRGGGEWSTILYIAYWLHSLSSLKYPWSYRCIRRVALQGPLEFAG